MEAQHLQFSRRSFIQASSAAAALAVPASSAIAQTTAPNERLRIGFIGVGLRNNNHLDSAIKLQNGPTRRGEAHRLQFGVAEGVQTEDT